MAGRGGDRRARAGIDADVGCGTLGTAVGRGGGDGLRERDGTASGDQSGRGDVTAAGLINQRAS